MRRRARSARAGTVVSVDLFYEARDHERARGTTRWRSRWRRPRCSPSARARQCRSACMLAVSDTFDDRDGTRQRIEDDAAAGGRRGDGRGRDRRARARRGRSAPAWLSLWLPGRLSALAALFALRRRCGFRQRAALALRGSFRFAGRFRFPGGFRRCLRLWLCRPLRPGAVAAPARRLRCARGR